MLSASDARPTTMATTATMTTNVGTMPPLAPKPKKKKALRQAIGVIVGDPQTDRILMLNSRKRPGALVLPRGELEEDGAYNDIRLKETPANAALNVLQQEANVKATPGVLRHLGTFVEANKRGKTVAHHWIYEVPYSSTTFLSNASGRTRVWVTYQEALQATLDRPMSHLALRNSVLFAHRHGQ